MTESPTPTQVAAFPGGNPRPDTPDSSPTPPGGGWLLAKVDVRGAAVVTVGQNTHIDLPAPDPGALRNADGTPLRPDQLADKEFLLGMMLAAGRKQMITELRKAAAGLPSRRVWVEIDDPEGVWPMEVPESGPPRRLPAGPSDPPPRPPLRTVPDADSTPPPAAAATAPAAPAPAATPAAPLTPAPAPVAERNPGPSGSRWEPAATATPTPSPTAAPAPTPAPEPAWNKVATPVPPAAAPAHPAAPTADPEPARGPDTNPGQPVPVEAPGPPRPSFEDLLASRPDPNKAPATEGWRGAMRQLSGGRLRPAPGKLERAHRDQVRRIQKPLNGPKVIVLANPKGGAHKCLTGDTPIVDPVSGRVVTLDQVMRDPELGAVLTLASRRTIMATAITEKVDNGVRDTFRIRMASGRELTATPNHPLLTPDGWRQVDSLSAGMSVAGAARIPAPLRPVPLPAETVDLIAILLAEGGYSPAAGGVRFSTADPEILRRATAAGDALGIAVRPVAGSRYDYQLSGCDSAGKVRSSRAKRFLADHGMPQVTSHHKRIPDAVFSLPDDALARFLAVFWMCDGYVLDRGIGVTLASPGLVADLQHLLLRFGIQSSQREEVPGRAWRLRVHNRHARTFADHIPLWGYKADALSKRVKQDAGNSPNGLPIMTEEIDARLRAAGPHTRRSAGAPRMQDVADKLGWGIFQYDRLINRETRSICPDAFRAYCEVFGVTDYDWLWSSDLYWDRIVSIEPAGQQQVYDLAVFPTRCFIAADMIVHNTTGGLLLAQKFGTLRGGGVCFYDDNESRATASWRAMPGPHTRTVDDLLRRLHDFRADQILGIADLDQFVRSQGPANFDLLAAAEPEDPMKPKQIPASDVDAVIDLLGRFYRVIIIDTGNTMHAANWGAAVLRADQLVIVSNIREDTALSAGWLAQALQKAGREDLLSNAITVLSAPVTSHGDLHKQLRGHFSTLTRGVHTVPFDPALDGGGPIDYNALSDATSGMWEKIAADVADRL